MPQSQEERNQPLNSFLASPMMQPPLFAIVAEMNGTLLETMATAQKEWAISWTAELKRMSQFCAS